MSNYRRGAISTAPLSSSHHGKLFFPRRTALASLYIFASASLALPIRRGIRKCAKPLENNWIGARRPESLYARARRPFINNGGKSSSGGKLAASSSLDYHFHKFTFCKCAAPVFRYRRGGLGLLNARRVSFIHSPCALYAPSSGLIGLVSAALPSLSLSSAWLSGAAAPARANRIECGLCRRIYLSTTLYSARREYSSQSFADYCMADLYVWCRWRLRSALACACKHARFALSVCVHG